MDGLDWLIFALTLFTVLSSSLFLVGCLIADWAHRRRRAKR